jgi:hypothetical protein
MSFHRGYPFDERYDPYDRGYDEPYDRPAGPPDRLAHLVFLDGRLIDAWTEPTAGSRWQGTADRLDREARPVATSPPMAPAHVRGLEWLSDVCGGIGPLDELDATAHSADPTALPLDDLDLRTRHRVEGAVDLLDSVVAGQFDDELLSLCHVALRTLVASAPEVVRGAPSAAHLVGGICWAIGKANGLYGTRGALTQTSMQKALALPQPLSVQGQKVTTGLRGLLPGRQRPHEWRGVPDLEPLGRTDLLTTRTREQLVQLRDQLRSQHAATPPP